MKRKTKKVIKEYFFVTNIQNIGLKIYLDNGHMYPFFYNDRTDEEHNLPEISISFSASSDKERIEKRLSILFDTLFNVGEKIFADAYTTEDNYASLINFYTDISWLKNKNGKTVWKRRQRYGR
jgi:hypothetical protein